jgi:M6 family metalloprotease-like protein
MFIDDCLYPLFLNIIIMTLHKKFITVFLILFSCCSIYGAYLKNVPQKLIQPDGTIIYCFASGDEYHHWLHDSTGYTIVQNTQGYYVYATLLEEELVASPYIVGSVNPETVGLKPYINISAKTWIAKRAAIEQIPEPLRQHKAAQKNEGLINNLAFFIAFADDAGYTTTYSVLTEMYNDSSSEESNSLYNFYRLSSYGKLYIRTHFFPEPYGDNVVPYRDEHSRRYFQPYSENNPEGYNGSEDSRNREHALLKRTVHYFNEQNSIPTSLNLDFNNDGLVDNICFIVTGATDGWNDLLWPHRFSLWTDTVYINGKRVYDYNFQIEEDSYPGVITHEMMHTLSAPDLYRYYSTQNVDPVGRWDLMASTTRSSPQGLGAYMKYRYGGWIDTIPEITRPGTYTLYPANGTSPEKTAYIIRSNDLLAADNYLVLEYRNMASNIFEGNLPGSGLLIYRINTKFEGEGNASYDGEEVFDEIYLYRPNGTTTENGNLSLAHFTKDEGRTTFNMLSNPYPFDHTGYPISTIYITDITEAGDSIQFTIKEQIDTLTVNTNEIVLDCKEGSKDNFSINSNTHWIISHLNAPWLSVNKTTGSGNSSITLQASQNSQSTERTATIRVFTSSETYTRDIKVRQLPCNRIEQINHKSVINIFPNPAKERLTIVYPELSQTHIFIYAITGQRIPFSVIERDKNKMVIDISKFPSGIYYIKFSSAKQSTVKSFIVK